MFGALYNECRIMFELAAKGPVSIRSGEKLELDPALPDDQFIRSFHDGENSIVIPGSSIKGVFRSRAERLLGNCCKVFDRECFDKSKELKTAKEKYRMLCPACKMFGNMSMKSRIEFKDAFPVKNTVKLATRHNVGINRVSGAAAHNVLFEPEVLEQGVFKVEIMMKNFFKWQLKTILQILDDINEGYVTFGGVSSRGFGRMSADGVSVVVRDYTRRIEGGFFAEREFAGAELRDLLKNVELGWKEIGKDDIDGHRL